MELTHQLTPMLRTLRLSGVLETLEVRNHQAVEQQSSFVEFLTTLLHDEVERRAQSTLRLRLRRAAFDPAKTLEGFDFSFNPKLNKAQVFDLATCAFIERHENALIYGPTGVGKSHLAQALAHEACRRGHEVLFINTRYEKASIALTSNRDRSEWPDLFGDALLASAALDRLTHGAHFVEITGPSFRAEAIKKQVTTRRARAAN